ncbi:MAG: hypothetical protein ACKOYM_04890 [Actinomycetes bacterium]
MPDVPPSAQFRVDHAEVVVTAAERQAKNLTHWPDGTIGSVRRKGQLISIGPNGSGLARSEQPVHRWWRRQRDQSAMGQITGTDGVVDALRSPADYVAGGPLHYEANADLLVLVYHAEEHPDGDPTRFYATLGLAASTDGGHRFTDLGRVVRPELPPEAAARASGPVEMGPGSLLVTAEQYIVLFHDFLPNGRRINLAAAAAPRDELIEAARRGESIEWKKYDGSSFTTPAWGGRATELLPAVIGTDAVEWMDTVWLPDQQCWAMVASSSVFGAWTLTTAYSYDGVRWSQPRVVRGSRSLAEALYVSIDRSALLSRRTPRSSSELAVFRVISPSGGYQRWDDAEVERLVLVPDNPPAMQHGGLQP